ncbi:hypothetical protein LguiB_004187 [Lonicera macranthoides]
MASRRHRGGQSRPRSARKGAHAVTHVECRVIMVAWEKEEGTKELIVKLGETVLVPPEQETHKGTPKFLSNLDQNIPPIVRTIYGCDKFEGKSNKIVCRVIRDALSNILIHYYPLAGRVVVGKDQKLAECTSQGAFFIEAEANYIG